MKTNLILFLFLILCLGAKSQKMYPYSFTPSNSTYTNLAGATNLTAGKVWDDTLMTIPLGFTFKWALANRNIDSIAIDSDGILHAPQDFVQVLDNPIRAMMPYQADMSDRAYNTSTTAISPISYLTTGSAGNRICKIEFKNVGFYNDNSGTDFANFQVWLYETSNIIEYRYGSSSVANILSSFDGRNGPYINLIYKSTIDIVNQTIVLDSCTYVSGNSASVAAINPSMPFDYLNQPPADFAFSGLPANGQVFRFAPISIGSSLQDQEGPFANVKVYPTYIQDQFFVEHDGEQISATVVDVHGKICLHEDKLNRKSSFTTSGLSKGLYLLILKGDNAKSKVYKLIK